MALESLARAWRRRLWIRRRVATWLHGTPRGLGYAAVLGVVVLAIEGCAVAPKQASVDLTVSLNADSYGIGEPVLATVRFANNAESAKSGDPQLVVPALDHSTLKFYIAKQGSPVRVKRLPVLPEHSPPEAHSLPAQGSASRTFLFTRLTAEPGNWELVAALSGCQSQAGTVELMPTYYSKRAGYRVTDKVVLQRDPYSGLITQGQATALVRTRAGTSQANDVRAVLVPLEDTGLYLWTVFVGERKDWSHDGRAFTVNPYSGAVKVLRFNEPPEEGGRS